MIERKYEASMIEPRKHHRTQSYEPSYQVQSHALAGSIDAAAEDLSRNGPVSRAELAAMLAELESEWDATEAKLAGTNSRNRSITE